MKFYTEMRGRKHGFYYITEYSTWYDMIHRCENANNKHFKDYGGRGISVCVRWKFSFKNFLADMGPKPSIKHSLDRIDNNGNYESKNCRWATKKQQSRNTRTSIMITLNGKTKSLRQWCEDMNFPYETANSRYDIGILHADLFKPAFSKLRKQP